MPHRLTHGSAPLPRPRRFKIGTRQVRRKRINKPALRQAIGHKSVYILMCLVFFLMFSPYSVIFFLDEGEREFTRNLASHPEAVKIVIFLVMCKLVGFGVIFASMPVISDWFMGDKEDFPAPPDQVLHKPQTLSAAERKILKEGLVARGQVTQVRWPRVYVEYQDQHGKQHHVRMKAHVAPHINPPREGDALALLCDPLHPSDALAPSLLNIMFQEQDMLDYRGELQVTEPPQEPSLPLEPLALHTTLHKEKEPLILSLRHKLRRDLRASTMLGTLSLGSDHILHQNLGNLEHRQIHLDRPFHMNLSVWLRSDKSAELHVSILPRGVKAQEFMISFRADLPQQQLSHSLPIQQRNYPWLDREDLPKLWKALRFYAAMHGEDPGSLLNLSQDQEDDSVSVMDIVTVEVSQT